MSKVLLWQCLCAYMEGTPLLTVVFQVIKLNKITNVNLALHTRAPTSVGNKVTQGYA